MSVNRVILVGRLGKDPETRYTGGGQAVCHFSLATDETYKDRSGERQKRTEWHRITVWGKQAEIAQQYLKKGSQIYLEGSIRTQANIPIKKGKSEPALKSTASNFRMLGSRTDSMGAGGASRAASAPSGGFAGDYDRESPAPSQPDDQSGPEVTDEDIPF